MRLKSLVGGLAALMLSASPALAASAPASQPVRASSVSSESSELAGAGVLGLAIGAAVIALIVVAIVVDDDDDDTPDSL